MNTKVLRYGGGKLGAISLSDALDAANSYVSQGAALVQNVQKTINAVNPPSSPPSTPTVASPVLVSSAAPGATTPQFLFSNPMSTGAKVALGVGGAAVLGTIVYLVVKKKKKK